MKNHLAFFLLGLTFYFLDPTSLSGQSRTLIISLVDSSTFLGLNDALVQTNSQYTFSNALGKATLSQIKSGDSLLVSALGYRSRLIIYQAGLDTVFLSPLRFALREVLVLENLNKAEQYLEHEVLSTTVNYKQMKTLPSILSEPDILRPLANLPGVQSSKPGGSSLFVRGGDAYHNSLYLDGVPFYNMDHAFGFVSAIPTLSVESVEFYREGIPAQYSGALSSVMAVSTVQPSMREWSGRVSAGLGSVGMHLNAPLITDRWSIGGGFRISYTDILSPFFNASSGSNLAWLFGFNDFNLKSTYRINKASTIEAFYFQGQNNIFKTPGNLAEEATTQSRIASLTYKQQKENYFHSQQLFYSGYGFNLFSGFDDNVESSRNLPADYFLFNYNTSLHHIGSRSQAAFNAGKWKVNVGTDLNLLFNQQPRFRFTDSIANIDTSSGYNSLWNVALHGQGTYAINANWKVVAGLRAEIFPQLAQPVKLLPKLVFTYVPSQQWAYFVGYDRNSSFVHRYRATFDANPSDLPFLAADDNPVSTMDQISAGLVYKKKFFSWSSTLYYRNFNQVLDRDYEQTGNIYAVGLGFSPLTDLSQGIEVVNGYGYGLENRAQMQFGIARLDLAYTWSKAFRQADDLNNGEAYPFEYNREHSFTGTFVLRFKKNKINKITEFSLSYNYGTGNFTQFALQRQLDPFSNGSTPFIGERNNAQLPPIQHLDFAFNFIEERRIGKRIFTISVFNATLNSNIISYSEIVGSGANLELRGNRFISILPSFSYAYFF
jgi:hypothetical protein